jgi:hypothetical protein
MATTSQAAMRSLGDERLRAIARKVVDPCERGEVDRAVSLLGEDARAVLPLNAEWYPRSRRERWRMAPARSAARSPHERARAA